MNQQTLAFATIILDGVMPISQLFSSICYVTKTRFPLAIAIQTLDMIKIQCYTNTTQFSDVMIITLSFALYLHLVMSQCPFKMTFESAFLVTS